MRNAALVLGIIGGVVGMMVGFFSFGYLTLLEWMGGPDEVFREVQNPDLIRVTSFLAPVAAIAGGAMARSQAVWGGALLLVSAAGMYYAFGFNVFTMFPVGMCGLGGLLALAARQPDTA